MCELVQRNRRETKWYTALLNSRRAFWVSLASTHQASVPLDFCFLTFLCCLELVLCPLLCVQCAVLLAHDLYPQFWEILTYIFVCMFSLLFRRWFDKYCSMQMWHLCRPLDHLLPVVQNGHEVFPLWGRVDVANKLTWSILCQLKWRDLFIVPKTPIVFLVLCYEITSCICVYTFWPLSCDAVIQSSLQKFWVVIFSRAP